ncbi:pyridoxal phosphate-dependent decarboxylase family protein [Peribacillus sp. SCS-155]|uniref:pyridoxal phosphate-dependent decarboxylase family protein n=1 Tax=Peribacillus sedimenti TaxID=3115297 RepID=UPI00390609AA
MAFINPNGNDFDQYRKLVDSVTESMLEHLTDAYNKRTVPIHEVSFMESLPRIGIPSAQIVEGLQRVIEQSINVANPKYMGHMDSVPTLISCAGEFVSSLLNNNMLSIEMSPIFSKMETQVIKEIASFFGYDESSGGVMLSGGSLANLEALAVARNHAFSSLHKGLHSLEKQPVIFTSEAAHTSIQKAAMLLGLGTDAVIPISVNEDSQMDVKDLDQRIRSASKEGKAPFAIVATAGTTVTGSVDPILQISEIARRHNLWLHVDAAYGGALIFSNKHKNLLNGIENANSITFNPQKWMYIAKTCAMVLFKNGEILEQNFRITAPYMNDTVTTNIGEISVQGTRHAEILKLWLSLQQIGTAGYGQLIDHGLKMMELYRDEIKRRPYLQLSSKPQTNIICFRGISGGVPESLDNWNYRLQQHLIQEGNIFLSLPTYRGNRWLRAVLLNPFLNEDIILEVFDHIDNFYKRT